MTRQPIETVLTDKFLEPALATLRADGFVTDEHDFSPYRETISEYVKEIQRALAERGFKRELSSGFVNHSQAGYAYFIYDTSRFRTNDAAEKAVKSWLTKQYGGR
ncbi:MAG: hypothetical protein WBW32_03990 [Luteibacter sp.]